MLTKLEFKRQIVHILVGILIVTLLHFDIIDWIILLFITVFGFVLSFICRKHKVPLIHKLLKTFDRKKDLKTFPGKGLVFYVFGSFLSVLFFEKNIAMASIMILAFGDSVSRLVGPYGYLKHPFHNEKFLEGIFAGAFAAFIGAMFFVEWVPAISGAIIAMLIEGVDLRIKEFKIDDNLMIPVVSGFVMTLVPILI